MKLDNFLCCFELETGGFVIGWYHLISYLLYIACVLFYSFVNEYYSEYLTILNFSSIINLMWIWCESIFIAEELPIIFAVIVFIIVMFVLIYISRELIVGVKFVSQNQKIL